MLGVEKLKNPLLPEGGMALFADMNSVLGDAVSSILPDNAFGSFIASNALLLLSLLMGFLVLLFLLAAFFFDFITDAWKLPFAVGVDLLKYYGLFNPYATIAAAILGGVIFIFLSDAPFWKWVFAGASVAAAVLAFLWNDMVIGVLLAVAPLNVALMFISTIID